MVRSAADRAFLPALRLCWFPLLISTVAFGYGAPGLQAANFLTLFGALDRLGGFFVLASIREFAPWVDSMIVAGVAGTAITADLGARKIREELDALQVRGDHRDRVLLQGDDRLRRGGRRGAGRERGGGDRLRGDLGVQLRVHPNPAGHPPRDPGDPLMGWLAIPRDWVSSLGDIIRFCGQAFGDIFNGRVFHFFGEALRQAGILILGSALVIWGMVFILGLQCGIEGAYFNRSVGAPAYAGVFSAWCDLRE